MKINSLKLCNVKGISALNFEPQQINFITGASGAGKTSVMDALRYVITGKSSQNFASVGTQLSYVSADFDAVGEVYRASSEGKNKVCLNGKTTTAKSVSELFQSAYGVSTESLSLLTSSELLAHALGKDLAAYLLNGGFIVNDMTFSKLLSLSDLSSEAADALSHHLPADPAIIGLTDIDAAYQSFRSARPSLKKMITEEIAQTTFNGNVPTMQSSALRDIMTNKQFELSVMQRKCEEYPKREKEFLAWKTSIVETKAKLDTLASVKAVSSKEKTLTAENLAKATHLVTDIETAIRLNVAETASLKKIVDALDTSICPISKALVCTTDKSSIRSELENSIAVKADTLIALQKQKEQYLNEKAAAETMVQKQVERERLWKERLMLVKHLDELEAMKLTAPEKPSNECLETLRAELAKLRQEFENAVAFENVQQHIARAEALQKQLETTELLVQQLAPNGGVRQKVLAHSLGPLEDWCNANLESVLPNWKLRFDPYDNFSIVMQSSASGQCIAYESLSMGEQLRVIFVIMSMLNQLNGCRIALLDNLNALDLDSFKQFLALLEDVADDYDHIFIAGINHTGFVEAFEVLKHSHTCVQL